MTDFVGTYLVRLAVYLDVKPGGDYVVRTSEGVALDDGSILDTSRDYVWGRWKVEGDVLTLLRTFPERDVPDPDLSSDEPVGSLPYKKELVAVFDAASENLLVASVSAKEEWLATSRSSTLVEWIRDGGSDGSWKQVRK